ncbi:MAG: glycosyltransferase family 39 protein, partial [Verrucomicrobia bacterium]|nr:glycosyltransferase family 39 protein [Verrucomicrobiota bacterium]
MSFRFDCTVHRPRGESAVINERPIPSPPEARRFWLALAILAAAVTVLFRTGALPLIIPDEGRNAEVAREMKVSGAWLVPTYNGLPYLDKPAFYFKAVALSLGVFGDNELGARMPSALFGLGVLLVTGLFVRRELGVRNAALAVLVVATTPLFISQARLVIFDIALACFVCASIVAGYVAETVEGPA